MDQTCAGGPAADLLDRFADAFVTGNASQLASLFAADAQIEMPGHRCGTLSTADFLSCLHRSFFVGINASTATTTERLFFPTTRLRSHMAAVATVQVAGFRNSTRGTVEAGAGTSDVGAPYVDRVVVAFQTNAAQTHFAQFKWLTPAPDTLSNVTQMEAVYSKMINATLHKDLTMLNASYAEDLAYTPMLCRAEYPPFALDKAETMSGIARSFDAQRGLHVVTDNMFVTSCGHIVASFVSLYVGRAGAQMVLKDFDVWQLVGDGDFRVRTWWEFGLMNMQ